MSLHLFAEDVIFLQRLLKCCAFYRGKIDGIWGPKTDAAVAHFDAESAAIAAELGTFDVASERYIRTLQPKAQRAARAFLGRLLQAGISELRGTSGSSRTANTSEAPRCTWTRLSWAKCPASSGEEIGHRSSTSRTISWRPEPRWLM